MSTAAPVPRTMDAQGSGSKPATVPAKHYRSGTFTDMLDSARNEGAQPAKSMAAPNAKHTKPAEFAAPQSRPAATAPAKTTGAASKETPATRPGHTPATAKDPTVADGEKSTPDAGSSQTEIALAALQLPTVVQTAMRAMTCGSTPAIDAVPDAGADESPGEAVSNDDEAQPADPAEASETLNALPPSPMLATAGQNRPDMGTGDSPPSVSAATQVSGSHTAGTPLLPGLAATANADASDVGQAPAGQAVPLPRAEAPALPSQQVAVALMRNVTGEASQSFTMQLRPDHLGSVDVHLEIDAKGRATASFVADHAQALDLLKHDASHLVRALNEAGVNADAGALSFSLRDTGSGASDGSRGAFPSRPRTYASSSPDSSATVETAAIWRPSASNRLYDIHA